VSETLYEHAGPPRFTDELGFEYIIDLHRNLEITDEQRERFGAHVAQQNSRARTDAELHPIRAVPHWDWPHQTPP